MVRTFARKWGPKPVLLEHHDGQDLEITWVDLRAAAWSWAAAAIEAGLGPARLVTGTRIAPARRK